MKWGITSNLTGDFTINPDFAQIEADDQIINLTRFEFQFNEKRPFFLEGSDIFNLFGVLGLAGILGDLRVGEEARVNLIILSLMVVIVLLFMRTGWIVSRREGVILVLIGLLRWIYSFS